MQAFIRSASCISPQQTFGASRLGELTSAPASNKLQSIEPDYKTWLNIPAARRMSRLIKMGVSAAMSCLKDAGVAVPDAIIAGTGLGCMEDSEKFLASLINNNEQILSPTSFIFSTHNTVAGQVALLLQCKNYNFTHTHRGLSFENALLDAMLFLNDNDGANVLAGASDEVTETSYKILQRLGAVKKESGNHRTISGEGSAFFLLNQTANENNLARITAITSFTIFKALEDAEGFIEKFISDNRITSRDFILSGRNGDPSGDEIYDQLGKSFFNGNPSGHYKHLCGEYHTSTAFATWLAATMLKNQQVPAAVVNKGNAGPLDRILIFNHYKGREFSLILLEKC